MNRIKLFTIIAFAIFLTINLHSQESTLDQKVEELLDKMTLEEKVGQMTQLNITQINKGNGQKDVVLDPEKLIPLIRDHHIGSFLNGEAVPANEWFDYMDQLTRLSVEHSRLNIPIIYGIDHMHGASYVANSTIFPHNLNIAATFNIEHARNNALVTGIESADLGHHWIFAPVIDLGRNPLWPRLYETYGEDPHVAEILGSEYVRTLQNNPETAPYKQVATGKHYLGYSDPVGGWDRTPAHIPEQQIYEFFGAPFKAAIDAGLSTIMVNSGEINGIPVHASKELLTNLLRDYYGFEGIVVTDWADIDQLITKHKVAENTKEATFLAIEAGIDMSMTPNDLSFNEALIALVNEGRISMDRIDISVRRILKIKFEMGLFDHPYPRNDRLERIGHSDHKKLAYKAAVESIVLLKNDRATLPISQDKMNILVLGPSSNSKRNLNGGWTLSWQGGDEEAYPNDVETIYTATKKAFPNATVSFIDDISTTNIDNIVAKASEADVLLYTLGETPYAEGRGNINSLHLDKEQNKLIEATKHVSAKKILIMVQGRPRLVSDIVDNVDAVLFAGLPGNEGGKAIANILSGTEVPSGKLPISYPKFAGTFYPYNHKVSVFSPSNQAREEFVSTTLYEFGAGLSYTSFEYSELSISSNEVAKDGSISATVTITNTGDVAAKESILWFLSDHYASITRPIKELRHFEKIELNPKESKKVTFTIYPKEDLSFPDKNGIILLEKGTFTLAVSDLTIDFDLID